MTEQEKEQILRKMKNREQGDVASNDDDLVRSEKYMKKGQYARSKYKEFYDDVKLSIKRRLVTETVLKRVPISVLFLCEIQNFELNKFASELVIFAKCE